MISKLWNSDTTCRCVGFTPCDERSDSFPRKESSCSGIASWKSAKAGQLEGTVKIERATNATICSDNAAMQHLSSWIRLLSLRSLNSARSQMRVKSCAKSEAVRFRCCKTWTGVAEWHSILRAVDYSWHLFVLLGLLYLQYWMRMLHVKKGMDGKWLFSLVSTCGCPKSWEVSKYQFSVLQMASCTSSSSCFLASSLMSSRTLEELLHWCIASPTFESGFCRVVHNLNLWPRGQQFDKVNKERWRKIEKEWKTYSD